MQNDVIVVITQGNDVQNHMKASNGRRYRELFEKQYGRRISDATWYRIKKVFDSTFPITEQNIIWLADLKKQFPQVNFRFESVVKAVKDSQKFLKDKSEMSGNEFLNLLESQDIIIHANTLTKWFRSVRGFNRKRIYKSSELASVVLAAYAYKLKKENNRPINALVLNK